MRQRLFVIVPVVVFLGLAVVFFMGLGRDPKIVPSALIDQSVPAFELPAINGSGEGLTNADLTGAVTVVNVFASWCIPCRAEHGLWMDVAEKGDVRLIGINYKDEAGAATRWLAELGDPYERIGADRDGRVGIDWGVYGVPETFIVDATGRIRYKHVGPVSEQEWREILQPAIASLTQ